VDRRKALVVEDAADIRVLLCQTLQQAGFETYGARTGAQCLKIAGEIRPDLVNLDLSLPDMNGIEVCRQLRSTTNAYIVMLTARSEETDRLIGLAAGADDYIVMPLSPRELRARVGAMFRRPRLDDLSDARGPAPPLRSGELIVDRDGREVTLGGAAVALTRTEFDLLVVLMSRPRRVWERETLAQHVWHTDWPGDVHVVDVHIANLRRKLGDDARSGRWVQTVRGVGYRFGGSARD
jgi:DNA-binding response OmpR family regulator